MWIDVNVPLELKNIFIFSCNVFTFTIGVAFFLVTLFGNSNVFYSGLFLRKTIFGRFFFWKFRAEKILAETENRFDTRVENPQMIFLFWKWKIMWQHSVCALNRCDFSFYERSGACIIPKTLRHIFVLRSSSHPNSGSPNILHFGAHYFLWALRHDFVIWNTFYLKGVPLHVLRSRAHFIY